MSGAYTPETRGLLRIVADQMAATAEKAGLIDELRRANNALLEANDELERQYAEALEARRVKDEFLANVSHELRTPLTAVMGYLSILQEELSGPLTANQRQDLAHVKRSSERLLELVDDLLELTALKRGAAHMMIEEFDPRVVLLDAAELVTGRPDGVVLKVEQPQHGVVLMRSDRRKILKILASLLSNAYKFTPQGEVVASLAMHGDRIVYQIRDTGIGIPGPSQKLVFEEFRQVDGSYTRRYNGTGLGLALARQLARALGGEITCESAEGEGSTFTVELPLDAPVPLPGHASLAG
jgi:signal transduction histidine kinase